MGKDYTFDGEIAKYTARIEIRNAVKRGLEKAKHYKKFSKRVVDAVKAELPDYTVYYQSDRFSDGIEVWGNGVEHNDAFSLKVYSISAPLGDDWYAKLTEQFDRMEGYEDSLARLKRDQKLVERIQDIQNRLEQVQRELASEARYVIEHATTEGKKDSSYVLSSMFPELLKQTHS